MTRSKVSIRCTIKDNYTCVCVCVRVLYIYPLHVKIHRYISVIAGMT